MLRAGLRSGVIERQCVKGTPVCRHSLRTLAGSEIACAMLITVGWAALAAVFTFSIAMVVWGRNGDGTLNF